MATSPAPGRNVQRLLTATAALLLLLLAWQHLSTRYAARPTESVAKAQPIDINTAERAELLQVPGVGPNMADAILAERQAVGRFESLEELDRVAGIGAKTLDKLRPWFAIGPGSSRTLAAPVERLERKPATPKASTGTINVNTAPAEELIRLPGIGVKLAERIIAERGIQIFTTVEDLRRVSGIGPKTIEKLRSFVTFQ